jgi:hypothetical protein
MKHIVDVTNRKIIPKDVVKVDYWIKALTSEIIIINAMPHHIYKNWFLCERLKEIC